MSRPGREVILGVGGGIAAYKACDLLRRLQDDDFSVTVIPTPAALNFVGAATWEALSGKAAHSQVWDDVPGVAHIKLAATADSIVIAPATADLIARLAHGRADDLLTNVVLASAAVKVLVPAMHPNMWTNPATVENVKVLRSRGFHIIEPDVGRLTGADSGPGRFPETSRILSEFHAVLNSHKDLVGKKILITAGGTREAIDPVRYIGNRSSGKQGFALAAAAADRGAVVHLIAANCDGAVLPGVQITHVESADELGKALENEFPSNDVLIMCAAVADAKPAQTSGEKIKKESLKEILLIQNPDLLVGLKASKRVDQKIIGFAAETQNLEANASLKLEAKGLDLIYANDVSHGGIFGSDFTSGTVIGPDGVLKVVENVTKDTLANVLLDQLLLQIG